MVATLLHNFAAYAAALAGFTAAIIASDELGATGGANGQAFMLAITRVSEIWIGIVCAGIVLAGTDLGGAPRRLATSFASLLAEMGKNVAATLAMAGPAFPEMQQARRELTRKAIALDPVIDEALGESSRLRYHSPVLQRAVDGLFATMASWRTIAIRLNTLPESEGRRDANAVVRTIPEEVWSPLTEGAPTPWIADPLAMRRTLGIAIRRLVAMPADTPSRRFIADQTARALGGMCRVLDGLALLVADPARPGPGRRRFRFQVPDWLPALVNAGRAIVTIGAAEMFWIVSAWPNGAAAITWTAITVILFAPRADEAYAGVMRFMVGTVLAAISAAIVLFAVLPRLETFIGLSIAIGIYLVPAGALMAQPWETAVFIPMVGNFVPLLGPANHMTYDTVQFYNGALAIVAGVGIAALSFRLLPPLSPAWRTRRLLALTLRDLHGLATSPSPPSRDDWEGRMYGRLAALPDQAAPVQRSQLVAALSVGIGIIALRRIASRLELRPELDAALEALAAGDSATTIAALSQLDRRLAAFGQSASRPSLALRARGRILAISDAVVQHRSYFEAGAPG